MAEIFSINHKPSDSVSPMKPRQVKKKVSTSGLKNNKTEEY